MTEDRILGYSCKAIVKRGDRVVYEESFNCMDDAFENALQFCTEIINGEASRALCENGLVGYIGNDKVFIK